MLPKSLSVTQFLSSVKHLIEGSFRSVIVEGEISNLSSSAAGHWYFTLSDQQSSMSIACFRGDALRNPILKRLKEGDKVLCMGPLGVYTKRGTFQLLCKSIQPMGVGDLKVRLEELKQKLSSEGLFDLESKKTIPKFARKIAVITAEKGAALQDFLNIYKRRSLWMDIVLVPALVQGDGAPKSIISALKKALAIKDVEVIVLTRGGGSIEDLWAFNNEELAREIFKAQIPIISAVGHEIDFSISDYVSDLRVETPSAAAQVLTEGQVNLKDRLKNIKMRLEANIAKRFSDLATIVESASPKNLLQIIHQKLSYLKAKLTELNLSHRVHSIFSFHEKHYLLDEANSFMLSDLERKNTKIKHRLEKIERLLEAYNPNAVLKRGYTYISYKGSPVKEGKSFKQVKTNEKFSIHFHDMVVENIKND